MDLTENTPAAALERLELAIAGCVREGRPPEEAALLHHRAAQILLAQANPSDEEKAIEHLFASWNMQPDLGSTRTLLITRLEQCGRLNESVEICMRMAAIVDDSHERARLLLKAVDIYLRLDRLSAALPILRTLQEDEAPLRQRRIIVLRQLLQLLREQQKDSEQAQVLELLGNELEGEDKYCVVLELARLQLTLNDLTGAQQAFRRALELKPAAPEALEPVLSYLEERQEHVEMETLLARAAESTGQPADRAVAWRRLAEHCERRCADEKRAISYWWRAWDEQGQGDEPTQIKRLCSSIQDWVHYQQLLHQEVQRARSPVAKVEAFHELATFQREVMHEDLQATKTYELILQLVPDDEVALASRTEILEANGLIEESGRALRRWIAYDQAPAQQEELLRRLVFLEYRLGRYDNLVAILRRLDPQQDANVKLVLELRRNLMGQQKRKLALDLGFLALRMMWQAGQQGDQRVALALDLAEQCLREGEYSQAAECYRQVLELKPDHLEARARVEELAQKNQPHDPTPIALALRAEDVAAQDAVSAVRLLLQAAHVMLDQREGEREIVARYLRRAIVLCPLDAKAELEALEEALQSAGLGEELLQLLQKEVTAEMEPLRKRSKLWYQAQLYRDHMQAPEQAVAVLEQILALDPTDVEVAAEIRMLYLQLDQYQSLAQALERLLVNTSGKERIPLLAELGQLYEQKLYDEGAALSRYGELLALVPDHAAALSFCRQHDEASQDYRSVAVLLCRAAEAAGDPLAKAELHREIAQIAEQHLGDIDFAIAQWRQVIELCPADTAPRIEYRRLLAEAGRWRDVETALLSEISRCSQPEDKVLVYRELAALARQHFQNDRKAAGYLRLAQQLAPDSGEIMKELEVLYEQLGLWHDLAAALRRHAEAEGGVEEKIKLLHRAARIVLVRLKRDEEALAICRYVREINPGDRITATLMGEIYSRRGQWREKHALLREQIVEETDPTELGRLHLELGHLLLEKLQEPEAATSHFERAMELDSGRGEILTLLRHLYESQRRWDLLVDLIRRRTAAEGISIPEKVAALYEMGRIREEHQDDLEGAREAYERAVHLDPSYRPALTALRALAMTRGQWREVVALARQELQGVEEAHERAQLLFELSQILKDKLQRPSAANEALEEAFRLDPQNTRVAEQLAAISFAAEDWLRASAVLQDIVDSGVEVKNLHEYYFRLGLAYERLGQEDEAFSAYVKSFGEEPMYLPTLERLLDLCYLRDQWDNTLRIAEAIINTYLEDKTPEEKAALFLRLGLCHIHLAQLDVARREIEKLVLPGGERPETDPEAWVDVATTWAKTPLERTLVLGLSQEAKAQIAKDMEQVLTMVADHLHALEILAALSLVDKDGERALSYLDQACATIMIPRQQKAALWICAGDIAVQLLQSTRRAETYYRSALEIVPRSELAQDRLDMLQSTPSLPQLPSASPAPVINEGGRSAPPPVPKNNAGPPPVPVPPPVPNGEPRAVSPKALAHDRSDDTQRDSRTPQPTLPRPAPRSKPRLPDEES